MANKGQAPQTNNLVAVAGFALEKLVQSVPPVYHHKDKYGIESIPSFSPYPKKPDYPHYTLPGDYNPYQSFTALAYASNRSNLSSPYTHTDLEMSSVKINNPTNIDAQPLLFTAFETSRMGVTLTSDTGDRTVHGGAFLWSHNFNAARVMNGGDLQQRKRMWMLMNLYQEYRLKTVTMEWKPGMFSVATEPTNALLVSSNDLKADVRSLMGNPWDMVFYHDANDSQSMGQPSTTGDVAIRQQIYTLEEMQGCTRFLSSSYVRATADLSSYAVVQNPNSDTVVPQVVESMSGTRMIDAPWVSTKVYSNSTWGLNPSPLMSTIKIGGYSNALMHANSENSQWPSNATQAHIVIGYYTFTICFEFRKREFRAVVQGEPTSLLNLETNSLLNTEDPIAIRKVQEDLQEEKEGSEPLNKKPRVMEAKVIE